MMLGSRPAEGPVVVIILASLRAEGTPRLTLELCKKWKTAGIEPVIVVLHRNPSDLAKDFDLASIRTVTLDWSGKGFWRYLKLISATFRLCRQNRAAAVLSMPLGWHLFAAIGARLAGVRRVVAHVGNSPEPLPARSWWAFRSEVRLARPFTTALACCSEHVRKEAIKAFGLRTNETALVPNGVDLVLWKAIAAHRRLFQSNGYLKLCMVGTLEPHKDQETLIEAMPLLIERASVLGSRVRMTFVGDGSRRQSLERRAVDLGVEDSVVFVGSQLNIAAVLADVDVFVFSTTEREGQGIALVEAMAAGLPIVATDVGACREVLSGGECGILVAPHDPVEFANAVMRVAQDPTLAANLSTNAKQRAEAHYSIDSTADCYARLCGLDRFKV